MTDTDESLAAVTEPDGLGVARTEAAVADRHEIVADSSPSLLRRYARDAVVVVATAYIVLVIVAAILAPALAPYDPLKIDLSNVLQGPSGDHLLGTDDLGRDVFSRILYGARLSLSASGIAIGVAFLLGFPLGLVVGFRGGRWESIVLRIGDGVMALPGLIVILAVLTVLGNGLIPAMVALGFVLFPTFLRLTRGVAQSIRSEPYIEATHVLGLPRRRVLRKHVLPHVLPALIVHTSLMLGVALLVEAGLSYVGLGTQPPQASWGAMLSKAQGAIRQNAFIVFPPGLAITLTVMALNMVGDGLRDAVGRVERAPRKRLGRLRAAWAGRHPTDPPGTLVAERGSIAERASIAAASVAVVTDAAAVTDAGAVMDAVDAPFGEQPALEIRNLTVAFPIGTRMVPVVQDVSIRVGRGEVVGLVGESGCGKTVTALAAIGLITPPGRVLGGSIVVGGDELVGRRERDLRRLRGNTVAMVFQDPSSSLDPAHTVGDQIGESLRIHRHLSRRRARARSIELLDQVGIPDSARRVDAYPHEFSGGMAQRVAIASALACDPSLLIADEPTTALDVTVQAEILDLLRQLQAERDMAILLVTHDLGVIADICQRAIVMYAGQVVETAPVGELFAAPQHPYSAALVAALPRREHKGLRLPTIPGSVPSPGSWGIGCHFADRCPHVTDRCRAAPVDERWIGAHRSARCVLVDEGRA